MGERPPIGRRADYPHFHDIPTRWMDNDLYGHVNNVVYYSYFDTVVNRYLIDPGGLDIHGGDTVGVVAETTCRFYRGFVYPELVQAGLRVRRLGRSSVTYEIGLFAPGEDDARAEGHFVHVFVARGTSKAQPIPDGIRAALSAIAIA
ncbi:MAG: thioesterase family protein [Pseudomonadota bacterium]